MKKVIYSKVTIKHVTSIKNGVEDVGIFDIFRRKKTEDAQVHIIEPDQASGDEPIMRHPGSWMIKYSKLGEDNQIKIYIEYKTRVRIDSVANWFIKQLKTDGWKFTSWTPPYIIEKGAREVVPFITLVCEKRDFERREFITCSVGMNWYPKHTKIWVDHRERW